MYNVISTRGPDAVEFLQGQLTQDVARVSGDGVWLSAWCNPKGRVFVTMRLYPLNDGIGLVIPENLCDAVIQRLTMYRLRAKVDIAVADDPSHVPDQATSSLADLIRSGVPVIDSSNSEEFTPHMLNLDKLGAISFEKGCYTGQEVVARTENLGKSKRRMMRYTAEGAGIQVGDPVADGDRNVGKVVNVDGVELLAVTPLDLHNQALTAGGVTIAPQGLPYTLV